MSTFRSLSLTRQIRRIYKISCVQLLPSSVCSASSGSASGPAFSTSSKSKNTSALQYITKARALKLNPCCVNLNTQVRGYCDEAEKHKSEVSYEELLALLESDDIQLFDVREPKELADTGTIPNATNIPLTQIKEALSMDEAKFAEHYCVSRPNKLDRNIVFYGLGPIKSTAALELAFKLGYKKARHFPGGWEEWSKKEDVH